MKSADPDAVRAALIAMNLGRPESIELIETHISWVLLTDRLVYKLKKPVRYDFLDFSTVERRAQACRDELALNLRMAPGVYLAVRPITQGPAETLQISGQGPVVDWLVEMRRLPADKMLDAQIQAGRLDQADVERLAGHLAQYYRSAPPLDLAPDRYLADLTEHVQANRQALLSLPGELDDVLVRRVHGTLLRLLKVASSLLTARVEQGRVIDGHGDLRPEHICLLDPPVVFDCVEFSANLRRIDVVDELCFLAMECDRLQAGQVGEAVLAKYQQMSGDRPPSELIAFYQSYRACVRAKVAALRARQLSDERRTKSLGEAQADLQLADRYLRRAQARPVLVLVTGLMGTGKSTLAQRLAADFRAELIQTDQVRNRISSRTDAADDYNAGRYSPQARQQVYDEIGRLADQRLRQGESVIVDGVLARAAAREALVQVARAAAAQLAVIHCVCPADVARSRIAARLRQIASAASQARPELYDRQLADWQDSPSLAAACRIDTTASLESQLARAYQATANPLSP